MERDPAAQGEGPGAPIRRRLPKLGDGGNGIQVGIELHQAVKELYDDGPAIDVGRKGGIERGGIVRQHAAVRPAELRARFGRLRGGCHAARAAYQQHTTDP
jgi:hypothetical protein